MFPSSRSASRAALPAAPVRRNRAGRAGVERHRRPNQTQYARTGALLARLHDARDAWRRGAEAPRRWQPDSTFPWSTTQPVEAPSDSRIRLGQARLRARSDSRRLSPRRRIREGASPATGGSANSKALTVPWRRLATRRSLDDRIAPGAPRPTRICEDSCELIRFGLHSGYDESLDPGTRD